MFYRYVSNRVVEKMNRTNPYTNTKHECKLVDTLRDVLVNIAIQSINMCILSLEC